MQSAVVRHLTEYSSPTRIAIALENIHESLCELITILSDRQPSAELPAALDDEFAASELSTRVYNSLSYAGLKTYRQLSQTEHRFSLDNFGRQSALELAAQLIRRDLPLPRVILRRLRLKDRAQLEQQRQERRARQGN